MPTIVYLVHGMGCGTADGSAPKPGTEWHVPVKAAVEMICDRFGLTKREWLEPMTTTLPKQRGHDALWFVPVSYHRVFDDFRAKSTDRQALLDSLKIPNLQLFDPAQPAKNEFVWKNCLDVLLWWSDLVETRPWVTAEILESMRSVDALSDRLPKSTRVRRIVIAHSLGTAASTYALRKVGSTPEYRAARRVERFVTMANVAPFLLDETEDVYAPPLIAEDRDTLLRSMVNARHEWDPIPWLMPWRRWRVENAAAWRPRWEQAARSGQLLQPVTRGIVAPPGSTPSAFDVHAFANYLLARETAPLLAAMFRGGAYAASDLAKIDWDGAWNRQAVQFRCAGDPLWDEHLREAVEEYADESDSGNTQLVARLLRAAEILVTQADRC